MTIYTIGYGGLKGFEELRAIMEEKQITHLLDVRTKPTAWCEAFSGRSLVKHLGDRYVFMGDRLGGMGEIDQSAIEELARTHEGKRFLLMCAEKDPAKCHRHYEIAARLLKLGVVVIHLCAGQEIPADTMEGGLL